jgi:hypothetical protein
MSPMKTSRSYSLIDCRLAPPAFDELLPAHQAMLAPRKRGKASIVIASPRKPFSKSGFGGLAGHAWSVPRQSARMARTNGDF